MKVPNKITRVFGKQSLRLKRNQPHIMFGLGLIGSVTSTVLACRATLKANEELDEIQEDIRDVKSSQHATQRDVAMVYGRSTVRLCRLYGPSAIVGGVSVALLTGSHVQLTRRNTAVTAAYAGLHKAFNEYRSRVREEVGKEKERDLYFGACSEALERNGVMEQIKTVDVNKISPHSKFFDEGNPNFQKNAELNRIFIQCQQNYANQLLQARGYLFLNDVYDMLGIERSQAGQVVGWFLNGDGDNFVDFGIFEAHNAAFVNGYERNLLLDFNVDGVIINKI